MFYSLMHKDTEVAAIEIEYGVVRSVSSVISIDHMPPGTIRKGVADRSEMDKWWKHRSIPSSRPSMNKVLDVLNMADPSELPAESMGLSLSDHYWVRPEGEDVGWSDVNFFGNVFPEDMGDLLFDMECNLDHVELMSPDSTCDGVLKKRWKIINSERCLIKGGSNTSSRQEPFNEVIASILAESMGIGHIGYSVVWVGNEPYSVCADFITKETELISAHAVISSDVKRGDESYYSLYTRICRNHGVDAVPFLDRMFVLDYILANGDRHTGNFGIIRDPDTLEWIGPAPIYDSGSSLGYNCNTEDIVNTGSDCKPFRKMFREQLGLITSLDWFDGDAVMERLPEVAGILDSSRGRISHERRDAILDLIRRRIEDIMLMKERLSCGTNGN